MPPGNAFRQRKSRNSHLNKDIKVPEVKIPKANLKTDAGKPVSGESAIFFPPPLASFKAIFSLRFMSAIWLHITDCDETFNYWEPSHYLLFDKGFQTWEYSPQYALRSYFYLLIHVVPAWIYYVIFHPSRLLLFYFIRCMLAIFCTIAEVCFYKSVCREFGINVGRIMLVILIFSPGMFIGSTAFLPSSFSMYMTLLSMSAWFYRKYNLAVFLTALSAFLSWPFAALIGFPIAIDMIFVRKEWQSFFEWSALSAVILLLPQIAIDSSYYGKLSIAPWNIIKYNIFTARGPALYGTEPWYFYFLNGFLNFNGCFIIALITPALLLWVWAVLPNRRRNLDCLPYILSLSGLYIWLFVFIIQPHKEERFFFPVYPLIALCTAVGIDTIQLLWFKYFVTKGLHYAKCTIKLSSFILVCYLILGISRMLALYKAYHAPIDIFIELTKVDANIENRSDVNLCMGKEWHRFPSSFFLPDKWKMNFIESEFKGLLPGHYLNGGDATKVIRTDMNDLNQEEVSRYVAIDNCDYLIDMDSLNPTTLEPVYSNVSSWTSVFSLPFLDVRRTPFYVRSFYIPVLWEMKTQYLSYHLLKREDNRFNKTSNSKV